MYMHTHTHTHTRTMYTYTVAHIMKHKQQGLHSTGDHTMMIVEQVMVPPYLVGQDHGP